jgi:hypothetical protein
MIEEEPANENVTDRLFARSFNSNSPATRIQEHKNAVKGVLDRIMGKFNKVVRTQVNLMKFRLQAKPSVYWEPTTKGLTMRAIMF